MMENYLKKYIVEIIAILMATIIFSAALPAHASSNGFNLSQLPIIWDSQTFAGFFYDPDNNIGGESLIMLERNGRVIPEDRLQYKTSGQPKTLNVVKYAFNNNYSAANASGLEQFDNGSMAGVKDVSGAGQYTIIGWQAEKFVSIKNRPNKLSRLIVEQGGASSEKKTLTVGETWDIGGGWTLTANSIDAKASPRQVWFSLYKDGVKKDDKIVSAGTPDAKPIYTYVEKSIAGEIDVPVFVTYVDSVFAGATSDMVQFRYTWAIDTTVTEIKADDKFGVFTVKSADPLILNNTGNTVTISRDSTIDLMGNMKFKVANNDSLRFYPMVMRTSDGAYEVRGTIANETATGSGFNLSQLPVIWDPQSFAGFFYDFDTDLGLERLTVDSINIPDRLIPKNGLTYSVGAQTRQLKVVTEAFGGSGANASAEGLSGVGTAFTSDGEYWILGWQTQEYVALNGNFSKLSKLIVEQGTSASEKKTLTVGETWDVGDGWTLAANAIDARATPRQVFLTLSKDGAKMDDRIVAQGQIYTFVEKSLSGESDAPVFVTYIDSVFAGATSDMAQLKYTWAISTTVTQISSTDTYGVFKNANIDAINRTMNLKNTDTDISLTPGGLVNLIGDMNFRVADSNILRFYPLVVENVPPPVVIRGTVANGTGGITPPLPPQDLRAIAVNGFVSLNWNTPSNNGGSAVIGYKIYSSTTPGGEKPLATINDSNILSYNDSSVIRGQTYYYRISATNSRGEGPMSGEINITLNSITDCTIISSPGEFVLKADIKADIIDSANNACINIISNDVIFDGNGHKIDGGDKGNYGVYVFNSAQNLTNITLRNLVVINWNVAGIFLSSSSNNTLSGNNASNNNMNGIDLFSSSNNNLSGNNANSNNNSGIYLNSSSNNNALSGNNVNSNNNSGIYLYSSSNNTLRGNNASNNKAGIYLYFSSNNNTLSGNNVLNNIAAGIILDSSSNNNTLSGNNANSNNFYGIVLVYSSSYNTLSGNNANSNRYSGVTLGLSSNNTLSGNNANSNNNSGIIVDSSSNNTLRGNNASSNTNEGISLGGNNNTLTNNIVNLNAYGIVLGRVKSVSDSSSGIQADPSDNNIIVDNIANTNTLWDFLSHQGSINNSVVNLSINPTISFSGTEIAIKSSQPLANNYPPGYHNISKFVNITNISADSWLFLNMSYNNSDLSNLNESTLGIWKYNGSNWSLVNGTNVNTALKYVYANITSFSIFAPMGFDNMPPVLTIALPQNLTYPKAVIPLNVSADVPISNWLYSLNGGKNTSFIPNASIVASRGTNTLIVYANDVAGNWNSSTVNFSVDLISPVNITIISPENNSNSTTGDVNVTVSLDTLVDTVILNWNGINESKPMESIPNDEGKILYKGNKTGLFSGNFSFNVSVNGSRGNVSETRFVKVNRSLTFDLSEDMVNGTMINDKILFVPNDSKIPNPSSLIIYNGTKITVNCTNNDKFLSNKFEILDPPKDLLINYNFGRENISFEPLCSPYNAFAEVQFTRDVKIHFNYTDDQLEILGIKGKEDRLTVLFYNISKNEWQPFEPGKLQLDKNNHTLIGTTNHLTLYAIAFSAASAPLGSSSGSGGPGGGGGAGVVTKEPPENIEKYETKKNDLGTQSSANYGYNFRYGIYEIIVNGIKIENDVSIRVELLKGRSKLVKEDAPQIVHYYTNVWAGTTDIREVRIRFREENSWIEKNNISDMKMLKWDNSKWIELETKDIRKDDTYTYYEAKSNSLSQLAVVGAKSEVLPGEQATATPTIPSTVTPNSVTGNEPPKFNLNYILVVFAIVIFIAVIFMISKRTLKSPSILEFIKKSPEEYGEKYHEHLLEQYKVYVETADNISERQHSSNNGFLIFNSILISIFGILSGIESMAKQHLWQYLIPFAGLIVSITWATILSYCSQLNSVKYELICKVESELPAALFKSEWKNSGEGKTRQYLLNSYVEQLLPWIFAGIYILLIVIVSSGVQG